MPPCPSSPSPDVFFLQPPVSMAERNWPTLNISYGPTRKPPPSSPFLVQPWLPVCHAVLCSTRSSALSAGDRLFGIYPLLLCLSLHLQPFYDSKKQARLPLILFLLSLPPSLFSSAHSTSLSLPPSFLPCLLLIPSSKRL